MQGMEARVLWRFSDGKPGHDNQTLGLAEALAKLRPVEIYTLNPLPWSRALGCLMRGRFPTATDIKNPDLILGAGHRTHLSLLAARRARGGRSVVLMRPTLPLRWFDLCLIPAHDRPPTRDNVLITRGVLNRIPFSDHQDSHQGLFLIGGPSTHFVWNDDEIYQQIDMIVKATPAIRWTLTTSRRTPATFLSILSSLEKHPVTVIPYEKTGPDWVPMQLARSGQVWVSADSVSMVYEALSSGSAVGILEVPPKTRGRVSRGLQSLIEDGLVCPFPRWQQTGQLPPPSSVFNEAQRCAHWIDQQWLG